MLLLAFLFLLGNAFFVGAGFAVMAARTSQLEPLAAAGNRRAVSALAGLERLPSLLATSQLGITVCSVLLGAVAEDALHHWLAQPLITLGVPAGMTHWVSLVLALLIVVYLHVVLGEMLPKNLTLAKPDTAALVLVPPLLLITKVLGPIITVMEWIAKHLLQVFGITLKEDSSTAFSEQELGMIAAESHREGLLETHEEARVRDALAFTARSAHEVAIPRAEVVTVPVGVTPADIEKLVAKHGFSRFPLEAKNGRLTGYVHVKDVLYATHHDAAGYNKPVRTVRRLASVAADADIDDVLEVMRSSGSHVARLASATQVGGSAVLFLEDLLEELVGQVEDSTQR